MCIELQIHPSLTEQERKRLCRVLDCQRLTLDACMHAAQNERLPLRVVVQVIGALKCFFLLCLIRRSAFIGFTAVINSSYSF